MNIYYPIFVNLKEEKVLVIGGGKVAERKVRSLLRCHARVVVASPTLTTGLRQIVHNGRVTYRKKLFSPADLNGVRLVISATNDTAVNQKAVEESKKRGIFCNVVDIPDLCSFIVPSVIRRGDLTVAISTGGSSPALARKTREEIEQVVGPEFRVFLKILKKVRPLVQQEVPSANQRGRIYRELVNSRARELIRQGRHQDARDELRKILRKHSVSSPSSWTS
jgi:precorrin-2 dehydrogenase/sirohydrochlorin ferrochelatase